MINSNELRVGNLISVNVDRTFVKKGGIYEIESVDRMGYVFTNNEGIPTEYLEPIPLTEEILFKLRFKKEIGDTFDGHDIELYMNNYIDFPLYISSSFNLLDYIEDNCDRWYYDILDIKIETLHALQNLCFAITGYELDVDSIK